MDDLTDFERQEFERMLYKDASALFHEGYTAVHVRDDGMEELGLSEKGKRYHKYLLDRERLLIN